MSHQAVDTSGIEVPGQGQRPASPADGTGRQFLGRIQELKNLRADTEVAGLNTLAGRKAPRARVLLVVGRPGSGRTALAEEFVRQVADRYPDGVLRARLTGSDGAPVPLARTARDLLGALRLPAPPGADEDDLTGELRDALATRRVLLLLDGAADAEHVDLLLPDAPDSLVVAVSEGPLTGIPDVRPCTLGGLDTVAAVRLLSRYTGSVRITCDPQAAERLVEECGRMPAALVLAGGWLADRPGVAVAELARRLSAATGADVGADGSPLARIFALVHADLPAHMARVLRLFSITPAGLADPHTASALAGCSVQDAHTVLDDLTALGLARRLDSPLPQYVAPDCLLPMLHRVAGTHDRPAELQLARARMLERTVRLLQSCRAAAEPARSAARRKLLELPATLRFPSTTAARRWLEIRQPALLAAAESAVADGGLDTLARRLMAALVRALVAHRGTEDAAVELYDIHQLVRRVAERRGLHREQAAALLNLADLDARTGRTQMALARYRAALDAGRRADDPYATGRAMESLGGAHQELGDWQRAADWFGRALAQRLARDERTDAARLYGRIAGAQSLGGRYPESLRNWRAAVAGHRKTGDLAGQARAMSELARVQEYTGQYEESLRTCREAVEWARQARDERLQAALQLRLADTFERLGDPAAARLHRQVAERMLGPELSGAPGALDTPQPPPVDTEGPVSPVGPGEPAGSQDPAPLQDAAEPARPGEAEESERHAASAGDADATGVPGTDAAHTHEASGPQGPESVTGPASEGPRPEARESHGRGPRPPAPGAPVTPGTEPSEARTSEARTCGAQASGTRASASDPEDPGTQAPPGTHDTSAPEAPGTTEAASAPDTAAPRGPGTAEAESTGVPGAAGSVRPAPPVGRAAGSGRTPRPAAPHVPAPASGDRDTVGPETPPAT